MKIVFAIMAAVWVAVTAAATTVIPPSFDELVDESELAFRGRVTAVKSGWSGEGTKRRIATWVTFAVERTLRGAAESTITLEFIGGTVGDRRLEPAGWPQFAVGDRGVFFVENRRARLCPIVRLRHGRVRILTDDAGTERVVRDDYSPVRHVEEVGAALTENGVAPRRSALAAALTLADFEGLVARRSAAVGEKPAP